MDPRGPLSEESYKRKAKNLKMLLLQSSNFSRKLAPSGSMNKSVNACRYYFNIFTQENIFSSLKCHIKSVQTTGERGWWGQSKTHSWPKSNTIQCYWPALIFSVRISKSFSFSLNITINIYI